MEERTLNEIAAEYEIHPNQLSRWKAEFIRNAGRVFSKEVDEADKVKQSHEKEKDELLKQIGQLSYEVAWLIAQLLYRLTVSSLSNKNNNRILRLFFTAFRVFGYKNV